MHKNPSSGVAEGRVGEVNNDGKAAPLSAPIVVEEPPPPLPLQFTLTHVLLLAVLVGLLLPVAIYMLLLQGR